MIYRNGAKRASKKKDFETANHAKYTNKSQKPSAYFAYFADKCS